MTIGSELRQAREQRGLTLAEISERTKIRVPMLRAIERDEFKLLPGGVISRGFLRLFAREVGLDANDIGARFTAEFEVAGNETPGESVAAHDGASGAVAGASSAGPRAAVLALAALALLAVGYFALRPEPAPPPAAAAAGQPATTTGPVPVGTSSTSPPATATPEAPGPAAPPEPAPAARDASPLRVDLNATDTCWISVTADGEQVAFRALNPGERLPVRATREVVLRIGVPGNLAVSINEQRMPPSARPGTPVTLRITPANYRDLLKQ